jgi:hypothetical protein
VIWEIVEIGEQRVLEIAPEGIVDQPDQSVDNGARAVAHAGMIIHSHDDFLGILHGTASLYSVKMPLP